MRGDTGAPIGWQVSVFPVGALGAQTERGAVLAPARTAARNTASGNAGDSRQRDKHRATNSADPPYMPACYHADSLASWN